MALGIYVHVPFCTTRCGYCDFNTYLPGQATRDGYVGAALAELRLASESLGRREVATIFFGGGTPTLLPAAELGAIIAGIRDRFPVSAGAEVTAEANPDSVDREYLTDLRRAGVNRLSIGMQSAVPRVLRTLERTHRHGSAVRAAREAREAGFEHVSLDLIYGTPGETDDDWMRSVETALSADPDHISAYGLIVEPGTRLAARVARGELPAPDEDAMAARYELADAAFEAAGLRWYELCNWARDDASRSRHNLGYWRSDDWWGIGPGAHSHVAGERWWNVRHPTAWAGRLAQGGSPRAGAERPSDRERRLERVMLELRLAEGIAAIELDDDAVAAAVADGLVEPRDGRVVLTLRGRLVADTVTHRLNV